MRSPRLGKIRCGRERKYSWQQCAAGIEKAPASESGRYKGVHSRLKSW